MTKLLTMDLSNNNLTGTLPSSWSTLTKLTSLKLGNNNIAGEIPASWSSLS